MWAETGAAPEDLRPLTERYRPQTFDQVLGQQDAVDWLARQVREKRARGILLTGATGTGKTTLALITARSYLCEQPAPDGSPCLACINCRSFAAGNACDYAEYNCAYLPVGRLAEVIEISRVNPLGGRFRVFFLDEFHNLHPKGYELLLTVLEKLGHSVFIFASTRADRIPKPVRDRLSHFDLSLLDYETSLRHLKDVGEREGLGYEMEALQLLAELAKGHPRALMQNLDKVADGASIVTAAEVRRLFRLGDVGALGSYFKAVVAGDLSAQLEFDDGWNETPATKAAWLQEFLLHLYESAVLGQHRPSQIMAGVAQSDRDLIVAALGDKAAAYAIKLPEFWLGLMELLDRKGDTATQVWFRGRLHRLHLYVNEPVAHPSARVDRHDRSRSPATLSSRASPRRLSRSVDPSRSAGLRFLPKAKAADIWDAASFLVQKHGVPLNLRLVFRHDELGCDQRTGAAAVAACIHELGMRILAWDLGTAGFHYLYLHQLSERCGFTTTVVGHVPDYLTDHADEWLFVSFLPRWFGSKMPKKAVQLRITRAGDDGQLHRHWQLVRLLCRNLDPSLLVRTGGQMRPLVDVLGISARIRAPLGTMDIPQIVRVSRTIGVSARKKSETEGLPPLSAFRDHAWHYVNSGWERDEYKDRVRTIAERSKQMAAIAVEWPEGCGAREQKIRAAKLAGLQDSWPSDPRRRQRSWLGWWTEDLRI